LKGVDLDAVDPRKILLTIAADPSAPATSRVAACRALLRVDGRDDEPADEHDELTQAALKLLRGVK
jgi:hypothetical protein